MPPARTSRLSSRCRSLCPEGTVNQPVRAEIHLPKESILEGEVAGRVVRFLKTYQGQFFAGYRVGDMRVGIAGEDQEVHYQGTLSADGKKIEGHWHLSGPAPQGLLISRTEGDFWLHREN